MVLLEMFCLFEALHNECKDAVTDQMHELPDDAWVMLTSKSRNTLQICRIMMGLALNKQCLGCAYKHYKANKRLQLVQCLTGHMAGKHRNFVLLSS